jgi:hypothetical protein
VPGPIAVDAAFQFTAAALFHGDTTGATTVNGTRTAVRRGLGMRGRRLALLGCLAAATLSLTACGNKAGDVTCSAFGQQSTSDRTQTLNDLLSEHNLEVASLGNQMGVSKNVDAFCGTATMLKTPATKNLDRTLNDAVNWDAKRW